MVGTSATSISTLTTVEEESKFNGCVLHKNKINKKTEKNLYMKPFADEQS